MERQQRTRLVTALILGLVFATGFVVGMAVDRTAVASPGTERIAEVPAQDDDPPEPAERRERRAPMYEQVGDLDAEQRRAIDSIIDDFRHAARLVRDEWEEEYDRRYQPRLDSLVTHTRESIMGVMTPVQAQRYDSLVTDYERKREERRSEHDSDGSRRN